nr:intracellular protein transport protein USO1-like [Ipomoea batatas]
MPKKRWKASMKIFASHIDPQKEEELKWIKIEMENNVKRIIRLIKSSVNQGNRDSNQKRRYELIQLVEDSNKQYQFLYNQYDNLRAEVRKKCRTKDDGDGSSSASSLDSESYFSPEESGRSGGSSSGELLRRKASNRSLKAAAAAEKPPPEAAEDVILKDTLTSTTEVIMKETINVDLDSQPVSPTSDRVPATEEFIKELSVQSEVAENMTNKLREECSTLKDKLAEKEEQILSLTKNYELRAKELEDQAANLKLNLETSMAQTRTLEEQMESKSNDVKQLEESKLQTSAQAKALEDQVEGLKDKLETQKKDLEEQVADLKLELETSSAQKRDLEEKMEFKLNQVKQLEYKLEDSRAEKAEAEQNLDRRLLELKQSEETNSILQAKLAGMEIRYKAKEDELSGFIRKQEENQKRSVSRVEELTREANNLQQQLESLRLENSKLDEKLLTVTNESSDQIHDLSQKMEFLQLEMLSLGNQKSELEQSLKKKSREVSECQLEIEALKQKITSIENLDMETDSDSSTEKEETLAEKEDGSSKVTNLQKEIISIETEKSILQLKLEKERQESTEDLTEMEKKTRDLETKVSEQQTLIHHQQHTIHKLNKQHRHMQAKYEEANTNFLNAERKIDEMLEELRKKYEDSLRILSRRIRVAEQLHTENKEWYLQTREKFEQETKELKELTEKQEIGVQKIKEMSVMANDALASLDTVTLRFEKCTSNFINRISSMSCELNFAKEWVSRKHKAIAHVKGDLDYLLAQLDEKEAEIWQYREKVWKSEHKVRELEKMIKHNEDAMCDLKEEKREAIRQLCVWIDYHRSRCEYYKKMLAEVGFIKTPMM